MSNQKKLNQLGMPLGTATHQLRKSVLFHLIKLLEFDICYRCNQKIVSIETLSLEHKEAWLDSDNPREMFFDINNIAFSHLSCNIGNGRKWLRGKVTHGKGYMYADYGCRCEKCTLANRDKLRKYRKNNMPL